MQNRHFYTDEKILNIGQIIKISGGELHHMLNVKRINKGEEIIVVDGKGGMAQALLKEMGNDFVEIEIYDIKPPQDDRYDIIIIISLLKGDAMDWLIQKATELGVREIYPVFTHYSVIKLDNERKKQKKERFTEISHQALKQCRSFMAPEIMDIMNLEDALKSIKEGTKIWLWEEKKRQSHLLDVFEFFNFSLPVYLLVGSEGGFSKAEIDLIPLYGFVPATLGKRVLRAETAAISGISSIISLLNKKFGGNYEGF